ncbi:Hypp9572, partial [Branchiostoma lanceolatum]
SLLGVCKSVRSGEVHALGPETQLPRQRQETATVQTPTCAAHTNNECGTMSGAQRCDRAIIIQQRSQRGLQRLQKGPHSQRLDGSYCGNRGFKPASHCGVAGLEKNTRCGRRITTDTWGPSCAWSSCS